MHSHSELVSESKIKSHTKRFFAYAQNDGYSRTHVCLQNQPDCHTEALAEVSNKQNSNKRFFGRQLPQNDRVHNKAAFTLAEVLITLGIIGIVAAITIPMLMTKYEKIRTVNQLKKVYSELSQAFKAASEDMDIYSLGNNWDDRTAVVKALEPYIKVINIYDVNKNGLKPMCYDADIKSSVIGYGQYGWFDHVGVSTPFTRKTASMKLLNGACVGFDLNGLSRAVYIDVNGSLSLPNIIGKDLFLFEFTSNNSFIPSGYSLPYSTISSDCNKGGKGQYCAARIIRDGWQITYY